MTQIALGSLSFHVPLQVTWRSLFVDSLFCVLHVTQNNDVILCGSLSVLES